MSAETSPIRILIIDDHPVVRKGVAGLVDSQPDMSIVGHTDSTVNFEPLPFV
jgi:DNA-binding NarL/FixJ family response regulator